MRTGAAVILAAGASRRLGQPKQLVKFDGETLLYRTARLALEAGLFPVVVVLGSRVEECGRALEGLDVSTVFCPDWEQGMGASLSSGVRHLEKLSEASEKLGVMVLLCDQPNLNADVLRGILNHGNSAIVVSQWKYRPGPPVLFPPQFLNELKALSGEEGAQSVWKRHESEVRFYETGEPFQDVDCPGDLPPKSGLGGT